MSSVLNRTTKEYRKSVNTPDYAYSAWIHNPDLSLVENEPDKRKWIISGDSVRLATTAEIDAQIEDYREEKIQQLANAVQRFGEQYYPDKTEYRLKILYSDANAKGLSNRATKIGEALAWEQNLTTDYMTRRATVKAATTVADIEGVSLDFSGHTPVSPVTVPEVLEVAD